MRGATDIDLCVVAAEGGVGARVTGAGVRSEADPSWSPDGSRLAFDVPLPFEQWRVGLVGLDGRGLRAVTAPTAAEPAWSPDGVTLAVTPSRRSTGVSLLSTAGGPPTRISNAGRNPSWSPDGRSLVLAENGQLVVRATDGTLLRTIVTPGTASEPAWSRDGATIAYVLSRGGDTLLALVPAAGGATRELLRVDTHGRNVGWTPHPSWSPDSARIAFVQYGVGGSDVWVVGADGTGLRNVTRSAVPESGPAWQPADAAVSPPATRCVRTGTAGPDRIGAARGGQEVHGLGGADVLRGGPQSDVIDAGSGDDTVLVRGGGVDAVSCGPGRDVVVADRADRVARDCERVSRSRRR